MSKKPFDFLATDKQVFLFKEKAMIRMDDGFLVALKGQEGKEVIAPASHLLLLLGPGTSISQDAAIFAAFNDMQIAFVRGGCNIHSMFMSGRYQNPESILNQTRLVDTHKLQIAKWLMHYRLRRNAHNDDVIKNMLREPDIVALTAWEARWAKAVYKNLALNNQTKFTRDFSGKDWPNAKLNILNNALYSICTAICLACGLHPSVGFIHGLTRRGGLAFDLADILKNDSTLPIAFNKQIPPDKHCMHKLASVLRERNEERVKAILAIALFIGAHDLEGLENFCVGRDFKPFSQEVVSKV